MELARQAFAAVLLGLLVRGWRGYSLLDPFFFIPFACLSAVLAGPVLADLRKKQNGPILPLVATAVARSCGSVLLMLAVALVALNYPWYETWLLPEWSTALEAVLLSLAAATSAASLTGLLLARFPGAAVKWIFRITVFLGLLAWRFAPGAWGNATIMTVMDWGVSTTALCLGAALVLTDAALIYLLSRRAPAPVL